MTLPRREPCLRAGLVVTCVALSLAFSGQLSYAVVGYRTLSASDAGGVLGGTYNQICQATATGSCPGNVVPPRASEKDCAPLTLASCTYSSCYSCDVVAAKKICVSQPESSCTDNYDAWGTSNCGMQSSAGCNVQTVFILGLGWVTRCFCPGGYVSSSWYECTQADCY
jgi:hypothetical protein